MASFVQYSRKLFLITLPVLFKKWVGQPSPSYFDDGIRNSQGIIKFIHFYSECVFAFLFATVFN